MTWIDILEKIDYKKTSQEQLLKSANDLLIELKRMMEVKKRNKHNKKIQTFYSRKLLQMRNIFNNIVIELSGWATDYEISNLIINYNALEKDVKLA